MDNYYEQKDLQVILIIVLSLGLMTTVPVNWAIS